MGELFTLSRELARHRQLSQEAARWRAEQIKKEQHDKPKDMDDQLERARHKALMYFLQMAHHESAVRQFTKGMSPEQADRFGKMLDEKTLDYLTVSDSPGFADPSDEEAAPEEGNPSESDPIQPDPTAFSADVPET